MHFLYMLCFITKENSERCDKRNKQEKFFWEEKKRLLLTLIFLFVLIILVDKLPL